MSLGASEHGCVFHHGNRDTIFFAVLYTEQKKKKKKKKKKRPPRIFEFKGKTLIISGLLLYVSWDVRVFMQKKTDFHYYKN